MNDQSFHSELGLDYSTLEGLLAAHEWQGADRETNQLMAELAKRSHKSSTFPLTDWQIVERLWFKHSDGRFGFSRQLQIWLAVGAKLGENYDCYGDPLGYGLTQKFAQQVNWQPQVLKRSEIQVFTYSLDAPVGHLPSYTYWQCLGAFKWGGDILRLSEFFNKLAGLAIAENIADNYCQYNIIAHSQAVRSLAISSDGKLLISGSDDGTIKLWNTATGDLLRTITNYTDRELATALNREHRILVSKSLDRTIKVFSLPCLQLHREIVCDSEISALALHEHGKVLASSHYDGTVRIWNLSNGELLYTIQATLGNIITSDNLHPKHQRNFLNLRNDAELIPQLAILPNGSLVIRLMNGCIELLSIKAGKSIVLTPERSCDSLLHSALSHDGRFLLKEKQNNLDFTVRKNAIAYEYDRMLLVETLSNKVICNLKRSGINLPSHTSYLPCLIVAPESQKVYLSRGDSIRIWHSITGELEDILWGHRAEVSALALHPNQQILASGSENGEIFLWKVA